jgi:ankyrin repeat protein
MNDEPKSSSIDANGGIDPDLLDVAREVFDAARRGEAATLAAVIGKGVPPNLRNEKGDSLLMLASYHGHADAVRALIEHGADPDLRNDNGQSPIAGAAFKGFKEVVEALLAGGADVEGASPDGRTALMIAAMFNRTEIVDLLLAHGANPQARDASGVTPLDAANLRHGSSNGSRISITSSSSHGSMHGVGCKDSAAAAGRFS